MWPTSQSLRVCSRCQLVARHQALDQLLGLPQQLGVLPVVNALTRIAVFEHEGVLGVEMCPRVGNQRHQLFSQRLFGTPLFDASVDVVHHLHQAAVLFVDDGHANQV
jgi:hypothetical protein